MSNLDTRTLIELVTLIGGIVTAVYGSINSIRQRRADDAALGATAGAERVSYSKTIGDIAGLDPTYLAQVQTNIAGLEAKLAAADALLTRHGITPP